MAFRFDPDIALAAAEARSIVEEANAEDDGDKIEQLAGDLHTSLMSYADGPYCGLLVIGQLRLLAQEVRGGGDLNEEARIEDRRVAERPDDPRRGRARKKYLLAGQLLFPGSENLLSVRVANLSATGAKLHLHSVHPISNEGRLLIPQLQISEIVGVVWKQLPEFGVRFSKPLDTSRV